MRGLERGDPRELGCYSILGRLGGGGMGDVFVGRGSEDELVAIKTIRPHLLQNPKARERFKRETRAAQRLSSPFVAHFVAADLDAQLPWYATRYIEGAQALDALVHSAGRLAPDRVWQLAGQLAYAISDVHSTGLIHRDIKPSNVLVASGQIVLIDLGICREIELVAVTTAGRVPHSPGWASPELSTTDLVTGASDVFQWGLVTAFMALGRHPFLDISEDDATSALIDERIRFEQPRIDELPSDLGTIVANSLAKAPSARPSADWLAASLLAADALSGSAGVSPRSPAPTTGVPGPWSNGDGALGGREVHKGLGTRSLSKLVGMSAVVGTVAILGLLTALVTDDADSTDSQQAASELGEAAGDADAIVVDEYQRYLESLPVTKKTVGSALRITVIANFSDTWSVAFLEAFDPDITVELDEYGDPYRGLLELGAVDAYVTNARIIFESVGDSTITLTGAEAVVDERRAPWDGAEVVLAAGGLVEVLAMVFDLDEMPARATLLHIDHEAEIFIENVDFFAGQLITVDPGEVVAIDIEARTTECYCEFFIEFEALQNGEEFRFRIGDGEQPFRVSAGNMSSPDDGWYWLLDPPGFAPRNLEPASG
jgi:hypothetical protein